MWWNSAWLGVQAFTDWKVWLPLILYWFLNKKALPLVQRRVESALEQRDVQSMPLLMGAELIPFAFECLCVGVVSALLLPTLLGYPGNPTDFLYHSFPVFLKWTMLGVVLSVLIPMIPILGVVAGFWGFISCVVGGAISLNLVNVARLRSGMPPLGVDDVFWPWLGCITLGSGFFWLIHSACLFVMLRWFEREDRLGRIPEVDAEGRNRYQQGAALASRFALLNISLNLVGVWFGFIWFTYYLVTLGP